MLLIFQVTKLFKVLLISWKKSGHFLVVSHIFSYDNRSDQHFTNYRGIHSLPKLKYLRNAVLRIEVSRYLNPRIVFYSDSVHITADNVCILQYENVLYLILFTYQVYYQIHFTVSPCILIHQVLFSPTHALFHTTMYQSFKLY